VPDHDVVGILDEQRRAPHLSAGMRKRDAAARRRLTGDRQKRIADHRRPVSEAD
jgi:hypothetical protein